MLIKLPMMRLYELCDCRQPSDGYSNSLFSKIRFSQAAFSVEILHEIKSRLMKHLLNMTITITSQLPYLIQYMKYKHCVYEYDLYSYELT